MFKMFITAFVAAFLAMFAYELLSTHVQQVDGLRMFAECSINRCITINDNVYVIK
jgi:hypothetical protein